jgi:hypothetical protein
MILSNSDCEGAGLVPLNGRFILVWLGEES